MHPDWNEESLRVESITRFISALLRKKLSEKEFLIHQEADINKSMWEDSGPIQDLESISDFMQHIGMLKQNMAWSRLTSRDIVRIDKQLANPYFGRIDFSEKDSEPDRIYIGISSLTDDETSEILIYDWRAPVCGMFYDFETGPASYLCPAGKISGEITLKRQYRVEAGHLVYMFDSNIAIGDRILQEILASGSEGKMKSIVSTIQKEQNAAIRNETSRVLAVQGAAGSGKTSVAMHRASYLLYRHKKHIKSENLVILSSTDILGDYISDVLPELGEDEIKGATFRQIAGKYPAFEGYRIQSHPEYMELALNTKNPGEYERLRAAIRFKSSLQFKVLIDRFFRYALDNLFIFRDLVFKGKTVAAAKELNDLFHRDFAGMHPAARLKRIENRITEAVKPLKKLERSIKEQELEEGDAYVDHHEARALSHIAIKNDMNSFQEQAAGMFSLKTAIMYRRLFEDETIWRSCLEGLDLPDPAILEFARKYTLENIQNRLIGFEDAGAILYLSLLFGETGEDDTVRHLIVDEAQDYSPVQLTALSRVFPAAGITLLGDVSQNISPYASGSDLEASARLISPGDYSFMRLNKSYRSTYEINEFAADFLNLTDREFFGRHGELPEVVTMREDAVLYRTLSFYMQKYLDGGANTIAVITKTLSDANGIYQHLKNFKRKNEIPLRVMHENYDYPVEGIMIVPSYLAKGLEFDAVLIPFLNEGDYSNPDEKGLFYTALTRPLHHLSIFCPFGKLPAILEKVDPTHYTCVTKECASL